MKALGLYGVLTFVLLFAYGSTLEPEERARLAQDRAERQAAAEVRDAQQVAAAREAAARRAAEKAEVEAREVAAAALRQVERASRHIERVERAGPLVIVTLKPFDSFTDQGWFDRLSFMLGEVWPAAVKALGDAESVRVVVQADFVDRYGKTERAVGVQMVAPMAELRKIRFDMVVGPPLLNFAEVEVLRPGLRDEVVAFCGSAEVRRKADRFCRIASARLSLR